MHRLSKHHDNFLIYYCDVRTVHYVQFIMQINESTTYVY